MVAISQLVLPKWFTNLPKLFIKHKKKLISLLVISLVAFTYLKPQKMADIWLTRDQQGIILFKLGYYSEAANQFNNTRWQAFSLYGAEEFDNAAILYNQFDTVNDKLAKINSMAHAMRYVKARDMYQQILVEFPNNKAAETNRAVLQKIIDANNLMSQSQKAEKGDSPKELGDDPQRGEGAKKKEPPKSKKLVQYNAEQLLSNKSLNDMWLRQVQKDPGKFLASKFSMQLRNQEKAVGK